MDMMMAKEFRMMLLMTSTHPEDVTVHQQFKRNFHAAPSFYSSATRLETTL